MENTENLKKTALNKMHYEMGAKMVPFAGFDMPVQFEGVNIEHETVRKGVGVFDVSHMGEFRAKGPLAKAFVQRCTSNDVAALKDGKVQYTCLPNGRGGIVDDMLVYLILFGQFSEYSRHLFAIVDIFYSFRRIAKYRQSIVSQYQFIDYRLFLIG